MWVAEQCGVSENTVRNWMAKAPIPPLKQKLLRKLIAQLPHPNVPANMSSTLLEVEPQISLSIHMATDVYDRLVLVANRQGMDVATMLSTKLAEMAGLADADGVAKPVMMLRNRKLVLPVDDATQPE